MRERCRCSLWTCIVMLAGIAIIVVTVGFAQIDAQRPISRYDSSKRVFEICDARAGNGSSTPEPKPWKNLSSGPIPFNLSADSIPLFVRWEEWLPRRRLYNASFVQIGGNCGKNNKECAQGGDPIWEYATRLAWSGAVLEPGRKAYAKLCKNYRYYPKVRLLNALVSNYDGEALLSGSGEQAREGKKKRPANISSTLHVSKKLGNESHEKKQKVKSKPPEKTQALTLQTLWTYLGPPQSVDILVLDVEGNEPKILTGKLPSPKPTFILFESFQLKDKDKKAIHKNLKSHGYNKQAELEHKDEVAIGMGLGPQDTLYKLARRKS